MSFNLAVILSESARRTPDYPVAVFDGGQLTYRQLDQASDRVAASLAAAGIKSGERIALQLPNIPQFLISYFGILKAGAVVVPMNVLLRAPEIAYHLEDSGALVLITWEGVLAEAAKGAEAAGIGAIFAVGHAAGAAGAMPFEQLLDGTAPPLPMVMRQPADTAVIVYTSGTTGQPKGAELTHIQLYMNADIPGRLFDVQPDDVVITVLPLFHVFGLSSILDVCVRFGCTMSLIPRPRCWPRSSATGPPSSRACPPCSPTCCQARTWTATTCPRCGSPSPAVRRFPRRSWMRSRSVSGWSSWRATG